MGLRIDCNKVAKREMFESLTRSVYDRCMYDPVSMTKLTGSERNEARYIPPAKKKDKLLSLQMSHCLYLYYPFSFFLSSVFLSVRWDMKENRNNASNSTLCFISLPICFYILYFYIFIYFYLLLYTYIYLYTLLLYTYIWT
jgi:hypothetical protein